MAYFPFFMDIKDKLCVVIGGGKVALRKISTLLQYGVSIKVISKEVEEGILNYEKEALLKIEARDYLERDLEGAFMVIAATDNRGVNESISREAQKRGILSNISDSKEESSFIFPSTIKRGDIVIGITSSSCYPALSRHLRKQIEEAVPPSYEEILGELKGYRAEIIEKEICLVSKKECINQKMEEKIEEFVNRERKKDEKKD